MRWPSSSRCVPVPDCYCCLFPPKRVSAAPTSSSCFPLHSLASLALSTPFPGCRRSAIEGSGSGLEVRSHFRLASAAGGHGDRRRSEVRPSRDGFAACAAPQKRQRQRQRRCGRAGVGTATGSDGFVARPAQRGEGPPLLSPRATCDLQSLLLVFTSFGCQSSRGSLFSRVCSA